MLRDDAGPSHLPPGTPEPTGNKAPTPISDPAWQDKCRPVIEGVEPDELEEHSQQEPQHQRDPQQDLQREQSTNRDKSPTESGTRHGKQRKSWHGLKKRAKSMRGDPASMFRNRNASEQA